MCLKGQRARFILPTIAFLILAPLELVFAQCGPSVSVPAWTHYYWDAELTEYSGTCERYHCVEDCYGTLTQYYIDSMYSFDCGGNCEGSERSAQDGNKPEWLFDTASTTGRDEACVHSLTPTKPGAR